MTRTIIALSKTDKRWLDARARRERVAMTEVVRRAVQTYRQSVESQEAPGFEDLLAQTRGLWKSGDGLKHQRKLRSEWKA